MGGSFQMCKRCILDTHDDPNIVFDENGICNHCHSFDHAYKAQVFSGEAGKQKLSELLHKIKESGKNLEFDCIIGVSGGVDSTYLCLKAKEWGLRPLLIHFDNGWNSELAVHNIETIVRKLGFPLYTHVVNWAEFRDLQISYFKANVLDLEVPTDHGFLATLRWQAYKRGIQYVVTGHNLETEHVLPRSMIWAKADLLNLKSIHKKFGKMKLKTFPTLSFFQGLRLNAVNKLKLVSPLNFMDYNKEEAKREITEKLGWRDYGGKHYESIFTRVFQGYILPVKCGVDKRKAHLSNLIMSGQITREEALEEMKKPAIDPEQLKIDKAFLLKKLGFTEEWFENYMKTPPTPHLAYKSYINRHYVYHEKFFKAIRPITKLIKKLTGKGTQQNSTTA